MRYDLIVIGAGSGGLSIGLGLHELGFKVLLIDRSDASIGGECLNNGCVPSKAFIHASREIAEARKACRFGLETVGKVSLKKVWEYVQSAQDKIRTHENAQFFRNQGLEVVLGTARFSGKRSVEVDGQVYTAKKIAIATGSRPRKLKVPGVDQVAYYDNENIWEMPELPKSLLFIGAGPISMELGQCFARMGTKVTMVEMMEGILSHEAPEIAQILHEQSSKSGIEFHLKTQLLRFKDANTAVLKKDSHELETTFDAVVAGIGRIIDTSELNLQAAGIRTDLQGQIEIDKYLRTSNKSVYVLGDAANGLKFSHGAELQATLIINNFFSPLKKKVSYDHFSWVTFTHPEIATFGFTEKQLNQKGETFEKLVLDFKEDDRAIVGDYQYGKLILYIKKGWFGLSDAKILGGSMVAPNAGEMFQELVLAKSSKLGIKSLFNKIYAYPTGSRVNKTIVLEKYMKAWKPWMSKILKLFY